ncbi:arginine--tRNA ligase [Sediminibacterium ginsengisoli]|uniref:Arginine--tRNA ligase n=1 Tax=Sediminibacterium ginsengisoli TaxID=413434 RepID=A0A1T4P6K2_9BACT|nr:arginine--tRNA ligase [Sediminibacterium ginsengisoli]SJZ87072.1 arginyl-tRNA synthetase [Sediminibacterium ginsengisoli]
MSVVLQIKAATAKAIEQLYGVNLAPETVLVNATKTEFEGDYTIVLFAFVKQLKKSPDALGEELGSFLVKEQPHLFSGYNVIKGFLNLVLSDDFCSAFVSGQYQNPKFGFAEEGQEKVMVEYSSPNTNKPLHLGHLRNNFLGWSIAEILKHTGHEIVKTCIVNDRGIHICKSMIAWQRYANGATPESTGIKGDHFVGDYYVKFENELKAQAEPIIDAAVAGDFSSFEAKDLPKLTALQKVYTTEKDGPKKEAAIKAYEEIRELARNATPVMKEAQHMLLQWEKGDETVISLWQRMNSWVYAGFDETYQKIGSDFDKVYYESNTYLLGKDLVEEGLAKHVFFQKEDGSVWIDLTADGLDEKIVRRKDGTSVYITQDIGLAEQKQKEFNAAQSIYVVGDEQNYHFKVLKLICQKLGLPSADGIFHLSYGMVELPSGKMKSREGTVVDADDLVADMIAIARQKTEELGKVKDFTETELQELYEIIGIGALKFFLLRVDPKKKMIFNPEESIEFNGFTGPFIQYTHARIKSILRKQEQITDLAGTANLPLLPLERTLAIELEQFPAILEEAAREHDPSKVAIYVFNVSKTFSSFYAEHSIANAESEAKKQFRLQLAALTAQVIKTAMHVLGIRVPERM